MKQIFKATTTIAVFSLIFFAFAPAVFAALGGSLLFDRTRADVGMTYQVTVRPTGEIRGAQLRVTLVENGDAGVWAVKTCNPNDLNVCPDQIWPIAKTVAGTYTYQAIVSDGTNQVRTNSGTMNVGQAGSGTPTGGSGGTPSTPVNPEQLPGGATAPRIVGTGAELIETIGRIGDWAFLVLIAVASVFLIIAGFLWITAAGEPQNIEKARQMLINSLIGLVIALVARGLVQVVRSILGG